MTPDTSEARLPKFLTGGGRLAELISAFPWSRTSVGGLDAWPPHMQVATSLMLRSNAAMVMLWGEPGVMVYNDAYAVFAGARHPALLGANVREGWPEVADFNDHVMKTGLAGGTLSFQDQMLTLDRKGQPEPVWLNLDYSPLLDADGRPAGVVALVVETTAKVQAEQRINTERERFAALFEQAPSFMAMLQGPTHRIELANPNYLKLVGHRDVIGRDVAEALPDAVRQGYLAHLDRVYATGEAYTAFGSKFDVQAHPHGPRLRRYVDLVCQPIRSSTGEVSGIFVEGSDVTARVESEARTAALERLSTQLRDVNDPVEAGYLASAVLGESVGASRVGYGTIDSQADTLHVERDWCADGVDSLAGVTHLRDYGSFIDSLKGNEFISIGDVRRDDRTASAAAALEGRASRAFVNVPILEQGRLVAVLYVNSAHPRNWQDEELSFIREVAERCRTAVERARGELALRASEARLREANESLEAKVAQRTSELLEVEARFRQSQKMEAIGQLTGGIAHDFNNLLAGMSASLQVLQRRMQQGKTDGLARYIDAAQESVRRAASLTQRLLAFSRRQTLDPKPVDVNRLVGSLEDLIRRSVGPGVEIEVVGAGGLWWTRVDASQLENALLNLCLNARDAMAPDGGRLTIETANKWLDDRAAAERELAPGQYVSLCVTDTGCGMSPDVVARAFDPFYTTKPMGQGTGLGLSMVYGFVRQSGGQVRVYSEVGRGTTMCLYLPRHMGPTDGDTSDRKEPSAPPHAEGEWILVVEDEDTIRGLLAEELREVGYHVIAVADGPSALTVLQSDQPIDLLLSDVGLPGGLNGRQVADAGRVTRPDLKVLFLTGYAENAVFGNKLLEHGMEVITKPFDIEALTAKVKDMIDR